MPLQLLRPLLHASPQGHLHWSVVRAGDRISECERLHNVTTLTHPRLTETVQQVGMGFVIWAWGARQKMRRSEL